MNTRERYLLNRLTARLLDAPDEPRDADAQADIAGLVRTRPDAPYLLAQRVLSLESALEQAQLDLEEARREIARLRAAANATPQAVPAPGPSLPAPAAAASAPSGSGWGPRESGTGSFVRNAAAVGAGVVGGGLLLQGIESLMHGGHGWGGGGAQAPVEVIENNTFIQAPYATGGTGFLDDGTIDLTGDGDAWT